jgi:hypothetical protein
MLLGFVMLKHGTKENPEKISSTMDMGLIKNLKGVQRVTGCLAALSHFIARLRERNLLLYKLMKKSDHFAWTPEAQEAVDSLKNMLKSPPILTAPTPEELLTVKFCQPSHEFTFGVGMSFISYPLVLTPLV